MAAQIITTGDIPDSIKALIDGDLLTLLIAGANARAVRVAPCLGWDGSVEGQPAPSEDQLSEARMILLGAISRWAQSGSGAFSQQTAGPYSVSVDTRSRGGYNLWPSEIEGLQDVCGRSSGAQAFSIDTAPGAGMRYHSPLCSLGAGATYCSCGSDINDYRGPLYEGGLLS